MRLKKLWVKLFIIAVLKIVILVYVIKPIYFPKFKDQFESKEAQKEFTINSMTNIDNNDNTLNGGK